MSVFYSELHELVESNVQQKYFLKKKKKIPPWLIGEADVTEPNNRWGNHVLNRSLQEKQRVSDIISLGMFHWQMYLFNYQFTNHPDIWAFPLCIYSSLLRSDLSVSNRPPEETPVSQSSTTCTAQQEHFMKLSGNMIQSGLQRSKENICHDQTFSFSGSTENTTSHCGYWGVWKYPVKTTWIR